jgi:hypothetical protein
VRPWVQPQAAVGLLRDLPHDAVAVPIFAGRALRIDKRDLVLLAMFSPHIKSFIITNASARLSPEVLPEEPWPIAWKIFRNFAPT